MRLLEERARGTVMKFITAAGLAVVVVAVTVAVTVAVVLLVVPVIITVIRI